MESPSNVGGKSINMDASFGTEPNQDFCSCLSSEDTLSSTCWRCNKPVRKPEEAQATQTPVKIPKEKKPRKLIVENTFAALMETLKRKLRPNLAYVDINAYLYRDIPRLEECLIPLFKKEGWGIKEIRVNQHFYIRARRITP